MKNNCAARQIYMKEHFCRLCFLKDNFLNCSHVQIETAYRMAGFWGLYSTGREAGYFHQPDKNVVHLHYFSHAGIAPYHLYGNGFLAEYEKIHAVCQAESA